MAKGKRTLKAREGVDRDKSYPLDEAVKTEAFYNRPQTFFSWGPRRQVGVRLSYKYK